mmetsp:Transcript_12380/g.39611  ORF Transcript_12380/g.39611 Transcript_12380/m.39611 type:complete len:136 (-) Transcript_12380:2-409(-)
MGKLETERLSQHPGLRVRRGIGTAMARTLLPALALLALGAVVLTELASPAFVAPPLGATAAGATAVDSVAGAAVLRGAGAGAAGAAAAGLLAAAPAQAAMLVDEIIPYAGATSFCIMWGIVLGFVLLRLQEAFPE